MRALQIIMPNGNARLKPVSNILLTQVSGILGVSPSKTHATGYESVELPTDRPLRQSLGPRCQRARLGEESRRPVEHLVMTGRLLCLHDASRQSCVFSTTEMPA